jgi:hypothetical protein
MGKVMISDSSLKVCKPFGIVRQAYGVSNALYRTGTYYYPEGTVRITTRPKEATFSAIWNGRRHFRTISGKNYTETGLARKAGEFIRAIIKENPRLITFSGSGGDVRDRKELAGRIVIDDLGDSVNPTADELCPDGYTVVQNNDGAPDLIIPTKKQLKK